MRFTLQELQQLTEQQMKNNTVNVLIDGYPLLHSILIELRDERKRSMVPHYFSLLEKLLSHPTTDPNVLDKHGRPAATCVATEFAHDVMETLALLFKHHANPNQLSRSHKTTLEDAIARIPAKKDIIHFLAQRTKRTKLMGINFQKMFEEAQENYDNDEEDCIDKINILLDLKLVDYEAPNSTDLFNPNVPCYWVRTISSDNLKKELTHLKTRAQLSAKELATLRHQNDASDHPLYTPYSPATFIKEGLPIHLFSKSGTGVILPCNHRKIPFWFDGHREELTSNMCYTKDSTLTHGPETSGEMRECTEKQIAQAIHNMLIKEVEKYKKLPQDKHGVLLHKNIQEMDFRWNEGLFRYKKEDIIGIYVNPKCRASVVNALYLRAKLQLSTPLYYYCSGKKIQQRSAALIKLWDIKPKEFGQEHPCEKPENTHFFAQTKVARPSVNATQKRQAIVRQQSGDPSIRCRG